MNLPMLLEISGITKNFDGSMAVDNVSFDIGKGQIVGLVGPNGAGKSTIVHMILGLIAPNAGQIRIFGKDTRRHREEVFGRLNFMSPYVGFPNRLTVFENLSIYARLYNVKNRKDIIHDLLNLFSIADLRDKPMVGLSSGEVTCVGLCKAFLNNPDLLILDEPFASLDPHAAVQVKQMLLDLRCRQNITVLHTSHNMSQVEELCDRVILLDHGRVIADGTPIEVTRRVLQQDRQTPALREVVLLLGGRGRNATS
jgi:ABC-2 type transport system ATP-binding protein